MATMQEIQSRIDSVRVTRQIAQAMKLVANAKISRCRQLWQGSRDFFTQSQSIFHKAAAAAPDSPALKGKGTGPALYIVIGSDRGLCGGYNVSVSRLAYSLAKEEAAGAVLITLGMRVRDYFARRDIPVIKSLPGMSENPFYADGIELAETALGMYMSGEVSRIVLIYTRFVSLLSHRPTELVLLPVETADRADPALATEPGAEALISALIPEYLGGSIFGALAESALCEQSARMTSMDAAVRSCDELIAKLRVRYNRARQDAITLELNEIVGGAEALSPRR